MALALWAYLFLSVYVPLAKPHSPVQVIIRMISSVRDHAKKPRLRRTLQLYQLSCVAFSLAHTYH